MAAIAMVTALAMTACTHDDLAADDLTAAAGGDHPGVTLRLTRPTVTVTSASATTGMNTTTQGMSRAAGDLLTVTDGATFTVELTDANGEVLGGKEGETPISGTFTYSKNEDAWTADATNNLYVTGGEGTYRIRATGSLYATGYDDYVRVAQAGTMKVTDDGSGTGTFALTLQPVTAAVCVKLLADNGAALTTADGYFGCAFTGMTRCEKITFAERATNLTGITYESSSDYGQIAAAKISDLSAYGSLMSGTYPIAGSTDPDATAKGDRELMRIYKSASLFTIGNDGAPKDMTGITTFTVKAPAGTVELKPGKLTTLTIRVGAASAKLEKVDVSEMTKVDEPIAGYVGDAFSLNNLAAMTPAQIAALPTVWIAPDTDFSSNASRTWNGTTYANGYLMLAAMTESYYTETGKSINLVLAEATSIENGAFQKNDYSPSYGLKSISAPGVTFVGHDAFANCNALTAVNLPKAATIEDWAFQYCNALANVNLPMATTIGQSAFEQCALKTVSLPKATTIGVSAFLQCGGLTTLNLPAATSIGIYAFSECRGLTTVSLPATKAIGENAFKDCGRLTTVNLPAATSIGKYAFAFCNKLTTLTFGANITKWEAVFHCDPNDYEGISQSVTTQNIALTLSASQLMTTNDDAESAATFAAATMTADDAAKNQFAGYKFKSITLK